MLPDSFRSSMAPVEAGAFDLDHPAARLTRIKKRCVGRASITGNRAFGALTSWSSADVVTRRSHCLLRNASPHHRCRAGGRQECFRRGRWCSPSLPAAFECPRLRDHRRCLLGVHRGERSGEPGNRSPGRLGDEWQRVLAMPGMVWSHRCLLVHAILCPKP